jgi:hypothetical protein
MVGNALWVFSVMKVYSKKEEVLILAYESVKKKV